jgi:hypothetical protein
VTTAQLPTVTTGSLATGDQLSSSTLRYDTARAGSNKTTSVVEAMIVDGTNTNMNGNYTTSFSSNTSSVITPKIVTPLLGNSNVTKLYDSSTSAPVGFSPQLSVTGLVAGDTAAAISHTSAAYNSAYVSNNNPVTVAGLSLSTIAGSNGSVPSDYQLSSSTASVSAAITPKPVVASDVVDPANVRLTPSAAAAPAGVASLIVTANSVTAPAATQDPNAPSIAPAPVSSATTPVLPGNKPSLAQQAMQGVTPKTMSQWSDAQVQSLPAPQVAALESAQLKQVLRLLDADSQIRAINPLVLPKMDLQTLAGLSNKQINALTPEQLINMTKAQINFLMPILSPAQINALRGKP